MMLHNEAMFPKGMALQGVSGSLLSHRKPPGRDGGIAGHSFFPLRTLFLSLPLSHLIVEQHLRRVVAGDHGVEEHVGPRLAGKGQVSVQAVEASLVAGRANGLLMGGGNAESANRGEKATTCRQLGFPIGAAGQLVLAAHTGCWYGVWEKRGEGWSLQTGL